MFPSASDMAAILILVLPGFLAYRFAIARRPDPSQRTVLWQLSEIVEYSVYVHLLGVAVLSGALFVVQNLADVETHYRQLLTMGPLPYLRVYYWEGILLFTLYPVYVVGTSMLLGAYDIPNNVAIASQRALFQLTDNRLLGRLPSPRPPYPTEPIWWRYFNESSHPERGRPWTTVVMKSGDIYHGQLAAYPVLADNEYKKDFVLISAIWYPGGDLGNRQDLFEVGSGTVVLNTINVDSIQVSYEPGTADAVAET